MRKAMLPQVNDTNLLLACIIAWSAVSAAGRCAFGIAKHFAPSRKGITACLGGSSLNPSTYSMITVSYAHEWSLHMSTWALGPAFCFVERPSERGLTIGFFLLIVTRVHNNLLLLYSVRVLQAIASARCLLKDALRAPQPSSRQNLDEHHGTILRHILV